MQKENIHQRYEGYRLEDDGLLMHKNRVYVPDFYKWRKILMNDMNKVPYVGNLRYQKTIVVVRNQIFGQERWKMLLSV